MASDSPPAEMDDARDVMDEGEPMKYSNSIEGELLQLGSCCQERDNFVSVDRRITRKRERESLV